MSNVLNYFEQPVGPDNNDNKLVLNGTVEAGGTSLDTGTFANFLASNTVTVISTNRALPISGKNVIVGGAGLASLTLPAPQEGALCEIIVRSTSGNVVVTTAAGTTFDGTNNTATFNAAGDKLILGYASPTSWVVVENVSVTLSVV